MQILLNTPATGVMNANGKNLKRYYDNYAEEYAVYRNKTSILIPLPFGIYEFVPIALKRTIFFDFKCYEYIPGGDDEETKKSKWLMDSNVDALYLSVDVSLSLFVWSTNYIPQQQ